MDPIVIEPLDAVSITTVVDNVSDILLPDQGPAKRLPLARDRLPKTAARFIEGGASMATPRAEHGFSALIDIERGDRRHTILFDTGVTPDGAIENLACFQRDPKDIEAIIFSHGHYDHTVGMDGLARFLGRTNLPVYLHPESWSRRRVAFEGREPFELPTTSRSALEGAGFDIVEDRQPSFVLDNVLLITGEVDRRTEFERGFSAHQAFRDDEWRPDPLILDDQAAIMHVRNKGLVVLTGCGHAGIVNIVHYARAITGIDDVYAVVGGFHLSGSLFTPIIADTVQALRQINPQIIVPAHCTGWRATHALAAAFPDAFIQNSVGTRFDL